MSAIDAKLQFLLDAGADKVKHSGGTLMSHLFRTYWLLKQWGNPQPVCDGGLFHSIYGTNAFRHRTLSAVQENRDRLHDLIGPRAEHLAYAFGHLNRPRALFEIDPNEHVRLAIHGDMLQQLREIEAANLIEQGSISRWLGDLLMSDISEAAKAAITDHIKRDAVQREAS